MYCLLLSEITGAG